MLGLLNISEAMSIALHTCACLAADADHFRSARAISKEMGFSPHHFAKVVQQLARAGLLETERGPSGGAKLAMLNGPGLAGSTPVSNGLWATPR